MGVSPLHASTVGLILNPNTNRLSPQFHCVYDDKFETVSNTSETTGVTPEAWEELVISSRFRNDLEEDTTIKDTWEKPLPNSRSPTQEPNLGKEKGDQTGSPIPPLPPSDKMPADSVPEVRNPEGTV